MPIVFLRQHRFLSRNWIYFLCVFLLLCSMFIPLPQQVEKITEPEPLLDPVSSTPYVLQPADEMELFSLIQNWRKINGYEVYIWDNELEDTALKRLQQIKQDWSHSGFWNISKEKMCGVKDCWYGENLAKDSYDEQLLLDTWLKSPTHEANLKANYGATYIACEDSYCVQIFRSYSFVPAH